MKNIIGLRELRENTEKYVSQVGKGKTFTVVRRSKPIFNITPVDEWGDEGIWETVVDFTKINPNGVPAKDVLKVLKEIKKERK
ncbi:MAG TPA: type II toxin-antitoxin system prevent-host-death family antitoxin [Candidatus Kaiserbacteria bacterium]|nr:type II toxin-antitoxin system prevent-host-death family antitoxin [Candidatus Kaiserbacteria bacterium]